MRVLLVELVFLTTSLPIWRSESSISDIIDLDSYVVLFSAFWMIVFTFDVVRVWWKSRPRKHRIERLEAIEPGVPHGRFIKIGEHVFTFDVVRVWRKSPPRKQRIERFEAIEPGVPHGRFIKTGQQSYVVLLRKSATPWKAFGIILSIGGGIEVILYLLQGGGWIAESTMMRGTLELAIGMCALAYPFLAASPVRIEITPSFVAVDGKRLKRDHFGQFFPGARLSYSYGEKQVEFGGYWKENEAVAIVNGLNDLYEDRRPLP